MELRQFLAYLTNGHEAPGSRWRNVQQTHPVRPRTVHTYHGNLRLLFFGLVSEGALAVPDFLAKFDDKFIPNPLTNWSDCLIMPKREF
jgi:hypothetical protein